MELPLTKDKRRIKPDKKVVQPPDVYAIGFVWGGYVCYESFDGPVAFMLTGGNA